VYTFILRHNVTHQECNGELGDKETVTRSTSLSKDLKRT